MLLMKNVSLGQRRSVESHEVDVRMICPSAFRFFPCVFIFIFSLHGWQHSDAPVFLDLARNRKGSAMYTIYKVRGGHF